MPRSINLSLSDELRGFLDQNSGNGTLFSTPSEFVRALIPPEEGTAGRGGAPRGRPCRLRRCSPRSHARLHRRPHCHDRRVPGSNPGLVTSLHLTHRAPSDIDAIERFSATR